MRVKVLRAFIDKTTGRGYGIGEDYEAGQARLMALHKSGFVSKPNVKPKGGAQNGSNKRNP